jgi:hypothetical protein
MLLYSEGPGIRASAYDWQGKIQFSSKQGVPEIN